MKEIRDAGRCLCDLWESEPTGPWVLLQILTLVNECTFPEELLTFGGAKPVSGSVMEEAQSSWDHGCCIPGCIPAGRHPAPTLHLPAALTEIIAEFLERKKTQSAAGGFLPEALSAGGHLWQSSVTEPGIVTQGLLSCCGRSRVGDWKCCRQHNDSAWWKCKGFLTPLTLVWDMRGQQSMCWCHLCYFKWMFYVLVTACWTVQGLAQSCLQKWWPCGFGASGNVPLWIYCWDSGPDWFSWKDRAQKQTFLKGKFRNEHDSSVRCCFFEGIQSSEM